MDGYYVLDRLIAIPYPRLEVIINIIFKEENSYHITIGNIPHCTCIPKIYKMSS